MFGAVKAIKKWLMFQEVRLRQHWMILVLLERVLLHAAWVCDELLMGKDHLGSH
jgi:hypothetical protein